MQISIRDDQTLLEGINSYVDYYLKFVADETSLRSALGLDEIPPALARIEGLARYQTADTTHNNPVPHLISVSMGDYASVFISPIDGRLLEFEMFVGPGPWPELNTSLPTVEQGGAIRLPLDHPYDISVFFQSTAWIEPKGDRYPNVVCHVSAGQELDLFRVQFLPAEPLTMYLRIANCLIAGIDNKGMLAELWFEDVEHRDPRG